MRPLILIGGGGHCKSVIEAAESCGMEIKGILDLPSTVGSSCLGYPVIGTDEDIPRYASQYSFVVTMGFIKTPQKRIRLHRMIEKAGGGFATVIASTAHVSGYAKIGAGSVVLHGATINADAIIGNGCIINTQANIEHDVTIGNFCHISTGAMVNGGCLIEQNTFIGSGSIICNGLHICQDCVIGAGSVVISDILVPGIYVGAPTKLKGVTK